MTQSSVTRRGFVKGGLAASALVALAGCGKKGDSSSAGTDSSPNSDSAAYDDSATVKYYISNPDCIDHYNLNEDQGTQVGYMVFDSLTDYDFKAKSLVPKAAESWESNDDATEFTFHLRQGATFHNGDPVTSKDFKRGWTRVVSPSFAVKSAGTLDYHLSLVKGHDEVLAGTTNDFSGLECPDDYTLVVNLTSSYADFPYVCSHPALAPAPKAAEDDPDSFYTAPIGNGPFQMDGSWADGQYINLKRFDNYYGDKPTVAAIQYNIQKDVATAYREYQAGNYDICTVPSAQISDAISQYGQSDDGYTATPNKQIMTGAELATYYIVFNVNDEVLQDADVRRAISLAINRQAIVDTLFSGIRQTASDILPPAMDGYVENSWPYAHYDKDAATALLDKNHPADASGSRGISIQLSYNPEGDHKSIMEMVQADLQAVGIDATSDTREWSTILDDYRKGNYQSGRLGWTADYPIPDNFLYSLFRSGSGDNMSGFSDADVDAKLDAARTTVDDDKRIAAMKEVDAIIGEACPCAPIMYYSHLTATSSSMLSYYFDAGRRNHVESAQKSK
jgi:peptide/nickel transport system substrate-binding protein/oligopeptide transport system substrate-binding protein